MLLVVLSLFSCSRYRTFGSDFTSNHRLFAQLQVASTIGANLAAQVIDVCAEQFDQFAMTYKRQSSLFVYMILLTVFVVVVLRF